MVFNTLSQVKRRYVRTNYMALIVKKTLVGGKELKTVLIIALVS